VLPVGDVLPSRTRPVVTVGLIVVTAGLAAYLLGFSEPAPSVGAASVRGISVAAAALYLWLFGPTLEDRLGHGRFLACYALCGAAAIGGARLVPDASPLAPAFASGGVSGLLGGYLLLFPRSSVLTLVPALGHLELAEVPAAAFLAIWVLLHLALALGPSTAAGVPFHSHAAAFMAGVGLVWMLRRPERLRIEWLE
jgi:membrane associated rhomboid family serine protease